jgi:hypothetical protein
VDFIQVSDIATEWNMLDNVFGNIFFTQSKPLKEISRFIGSKKEASVVLFGDSVSVRVAREDSDRRTLQKMVEQELYQKAIPANYFSGKGFHLRLFMHLISAMRVRDKKPDLVVVPINLRCFSPQWMYHPHWQFEKDIRKFCKKFKVPYIKTNVKLPESSEEYWKMPISCYKSDHSTVGDFMKIIKNKDGLDENGILFRRRQLFIFHYLYKLSSENDSLCSMKTLIKESGLNMLLYFTPLNYAGGEELLGRAFIDHVEENKKIVMDALHQARDMKKNITVRDYAGLLDSGFFFSRYDTAEHLNDKGRKRLSKLLAEDIEGIMKKI